MKQSITPGMTDGDRVLAIIPARGGSKGLPGKNVRNFAGLPLIAHSILLSQLCPQIQRTIVSTDDVEIAEVARAYGADVPFMRPSGLAADDTPLWPVLQHALDFVEREDGSYSLVVLLDPTSPARLPADVSGALAKLSSAPDASGIVGASRPTFNPVWHCVVERNGWMEDLLEGADAFARRQDAPPVFRINGSIYVWRSAFLRAGGPDWRRHGRHLLFEIPEIRAMSIDDLAQFRQAELIVLHGLVDLPWLKQ